MSQVSPGRNPPPLGLADADTPVVGLGGSADIGAVDEQTAMALDVNAGPIRLLQGRSGRKGWGLRHLNGIKDRVRAIKALGYPSCEAFVFEAAARWTGIYETPNQDRYRLVWRRGGQELAILIQWRNGCWAVVSALPYRPPKKRKVFEKKV